MYLVVRNRKRSGYDAEAYAAQAQAMGAFAARKPGFLGFKSHVADDGETVAISEWASEEAAHGWGRMAEHRIAQADGRKRWYADYTLYACNNPVTHRFVAKDPS